MTHTTLINIAAAIIVPEMVPARTTIAVSGRSLTQLTRHDLGVNRYRWLLRGFYAAKRAQFAFEYFPR